MKTYFVRIPVTGVVDVEVQAENEEDAIEQALNSDISINDLTEWDTCRQICKGNVFYGHTNEAEANEA